MKKLFIILAILATLSGYSQSKKKYLIESTLKVTEAAITELDQAQLPPEGELYLLKLENGITGEYSFDITIYEKGKVASVFVKGKKGGTIQYQNLIKDCLKGFKFNFKMPKGKKYKFEYTVIFN